MFKVLEGENEKILNYQSLKMKDAVELCKFINKMFKDGYKINEDFTPRLCPKIPRIFNLKFIKDKEIVQENPVDAAPTEDEEAVIPLVKTPSGELGVKEIKLDDLTKKAELLEYAKANNIEVPEDITRPTSIKKFIKEIVNEVNRG